MNNSLQNAQLSPMNVISYGHTLMGNMLLLKDMPPSAAMYILKAFDLRYSMCFFSWKTNWIIWDIISPSANSSYATGNSYLYNSIC